MNKNMDKILLKLIKEKSKIQKTIDCIENIKKYSDENKIVEGDSPETIILKKYLELGTLKKVCEFINQVGFKIYDIEYKNGNKPGRKYRPSDISPVITGENLEINKELQEYACIMLAMNSTDLDNVLI